MDASTQRTLGLNVPITSSKFSMLVLSMSVVVVLSSAWLTETAGVLSGATNGFIRVVVFAVVCATLMRAVMQFDVRPRLHVSYWLLVVIGFATGILHWTETISFLTTVPILGDQGLEHGAFVKLFGALWGVLPFVLVYRMIVELQDVQDEFQALVQERTLELQEFNCLLSREIVDRLQAENELDQARRNLETVAASRSDQLRKVQSQLVRQERLSALGKMATGVAHELNNTLSPVVAYADLLKNSNSLSRTQREWVGYVSQGVSDAADVIRRLKKFHGGNVDDKRELTDLAELIEKVIEMTRPVWGDAAKAEGKRIRIDLDIDSEPKARVNPVEFRQVLTNLILNSTESISGSGKITIRVESTDTVRIAIQDTGGGMTPLEMERCFEPFYTSKKMGTGLGLSVCHGLVQSHGGTLSVTSELNVGTTFVVELPQVKAAQEPVERPVDPAASWGGQRPPMTCLYVDDNEMLLKAFGSVCRLSNVIATTVNSAEEALRIIDGHTFDLVITDLSMAEMDGVDLIQEIRKRQIGTPIVLLTGWLKVKVTKRLEGMIQPDCILEKPATVDDYHRVFDRFAPQKLSAAG